MFVRKATSAKRKLENVPKRMASRHRVFVLEEMGVSARVGRDFGWKFDGGWGGGFLDVIRPLSVYGQ